MNAIAMKFGKEFVSTVSTIDCPVHAINSAEASSASVPLKPSAMMLAEGARAGGVTVETAWKIYQAMIRLAG